MSFKFGLNANSKKKAGLNPLAKGPSKPSLGKKKALLGDDDASAVTTTPKADGVQEIGGLDFADTISSAPEEPVKPLASRSKKWEPPTAPPTRKHKAKEDDPGTNAYSASAHEAELRAKEALEIDSTIYDYDAAYDALHAQDAAKAAERNNATDKKPQYLDSMFESAEQRKKDFLRARDKLLQREREAEGDEFADKEKFVTGAYKAQQEEARQAEEEEKKRQEAEDEKKKKHGMQSFHKQMLAEQEKRHKEAMEAAAKALKEGVKLPVEEAKKTDAEIVEEMRKQGKEIMLNDDGEIADKRQLLSAGLNVSAKPKAASTTATSSASTSAYQNPYKKPVQGRAAQRERQTQMVMEQIEAANKRKADEEAEEQAKLQHAAKSQKTATEISSAKERYLQRKREAAAAKAAAGK